MAWRRLAKERGELMGTYYRVNVRRPAYTMRRLQSMVNVGDRVVYSNGETDEVNIMCEVIKKLPHLVIVKPVRGKHVKKCRTMRYMEVLQSRGLIEVENE